MPKVTFQANTIDSSGLAGGYTAWKFVPTGPIVEDANTSKSAPLTGAMPVLQCFLPDGHYDFYCPLKSWNYQPKDTVTITGQYIQNHDPRAC